MQTVVCEARRGRTGVSIIRAVRRGIAATWDRVVDTDVSLATVNRADVLIVTLARSQAAVGDRQSLAHLRDAALFGAGVSIICAKRIRETAPVDKLKGADVVNAG